MIVQVLKMRLAVKLCKLSYNGDGGRDISSAYQLSEYTGWPLNDGRGFSKISKATEWDGALQFDFL